MSHRRVLQHVERYYGVKGGKQGYQGVVWGVWRYDDPEVQRHLLVVRLGGEGRFGEQTRTHTSWDWNQEGRLVPADGTGTSFHVLVVSKWRTHGTSRGRLYESDVVKRRRYKDPYDRWNQWQLQRLQDDD